MKQTSIKELIEAATREHPDKFSTQQDYKTYLEATYGRITNQSTISRAITDLKLQKHPDTNTYCLDIPAISLRADTHTKNLLEANLIDVLPLTEYPLLLKTQNNSAEYVSRFLKNRLHHEISCIMAQNDQIIIYPRNDKSRKILVTFLKTNMPNLFKHKKRMV